MIQITCDSCGKQKPAGPSPSTDKWIMGWDLEGDTPRSSINHTVRFLDRWDDRRILELGGIQFCSERCREKYLNRSRAA
ncbi:MAG TPA: hypothetical protein VE998_08375 [Terriglobales bacterium]|nr:hypothetical protein [Terriglobales bacterium]